MLTETMIAREDKLHERGTFRVIPSILADRSHPELAVEILVPALNRMRSVDQKPKGHRLMRVVTEDAGDERFSWDSSDFAQIEEAKRFFNEMLAKGMVAHRVDPKGKSNGHIMDVFDPRAEEMLFLPLNVKRAVVGG